MCTLSVISTPTGYRVVCNRDESRGRPAATPPRWRTLEGSQLRALWPTDTQAGGTWIAAGAHGLTLATLNLNPDEPPDLARVPGLLSRGLIIPAIIAQADAPMAIRALSRLTLSRYAPFRIIAIDADSRDRLPRIVEAAWDRHRVTVTEHPRGAACFASSGLGDRLVQCRLDLFRETVLDAEASPESQDQFHNHRWDDRPELSVLMSRADAQTVSISTVEVVSSRRPAQVRMNYTPVRDAAAVSASA